MAADPAQQHIGVNRFSLCYVPSLQDAIHGCPHEKRLDLNRPGKLIAATGVEQTIRGNSQPQRQTGNQQQAERRTGWFGGVVQSFTGNFGCHENYYSLLGNLQTAANDLPA